MKTIYETAATAAAGREGKTSLEDGTLEFNLSMPGSGKEGTNPEQLFALGYAACFDNAVKIVARQLKLPLESSATTAKVALAQAENGYRLIVNIGLQTSGLTAEQARQLLQASHATCPYSRALSGDADVTVNLIEDAEFAA